MAEGSVLIRSERISVLSRGKWVRRQALRLARPLRPAAICEAKASRPRWDGILRANKFALLSACEYICLRQKYSGASAEQVCRGAIAVRSGGV